MFQDAVFYNPLLDNSLKLLAQSTILSNVLLVQTSDIVHSFSAEKILLK